METRRINIQDFSYYLNLKDNCLFEQNNNIVWLITYIKLN